MTSENKVTILHFNDVYNIQDRDKEPVGGASRFSTAIKERKHLDPMLVFSGDAFNPSIMSSFFKGRQMVAVLNALNVDIAVYGNHDFDFGIDKVVKLVAETKFPWLLSNVLDNFTGESLADGKPHHIMEWNGKKIGFMGLVEQEWMSTLSTVDPDDVTYIDFVQVGNDLVKELKEEGADFIIALTHMRWNNDTKLAVEVEGIDLILGGHDHDFNMKQVKNGTYILKSGTDFRFIGQVTLDFTDMDDVKVNIEKVVIDKTFDEDPDVKEIVTGFTDQMGDKMNKSLGVMEVDLDGRFSMVRTQETNLGNFIADIMLSATNADAVILNGGTLRSDRIHNKGQFTMKDLLTILPFGGSVVVLEITGKQFHEALEIGMSKYPSHEGRFPQVAGMEFGFDPDAPAESRVDAKYIKVQSQDLDFEKKYHLAVTDFLASGKDGYELFQNCPSITPRDEGPDLHTIIQNHFQTIKICKGEKHPKYAHHQAILALSKMRYLVNLKQKQHEKECAEKESNGEDQGTTSNNSNSVNSEEKSTDANNKFFTATKLVMNMSALRRKAYQRQESRTEVEKEVLPQVLAPKVEGRIFILDSKKRAELDKAKELELGEG